VNNEFRFLNGVDGPPKYSLLIYDMKLEDWEVAGSFDALDKNKGKLSLV
jgi:hypothetical protein